MSTALAPLVLRVRTEAIAPPADPRGTLLDLLPETGALAWVRDGEGIVGWGEAARLPLVGPDRFARADRWWRELVGDAEVADEVGLPGTGLVAFGSFAFDSDSPAGSVLVVPAVSVGHRAGIWWRTTVAAGTPRPGAGTPGPALRSSPRPPGPVLWSDGARSSTEWVSVVAAAVARIDAGEVAKVVLARDIEARVPGPLDLRWPLGRLASSYPDCWTFAVDGLLGATPEMLVGLVDGVASSRVLAGTLRRSGDAAMDLRKGSALAGSIKDLEEHGYGVRSVVDALAQHCTSVDVPDAPFVLELPNVLHLATDISGVVADGSTSLGLLASLHPSAAVCGAPTDAALAVIRELEGLDRGRYAGPVGWTDARGDGEWGIALRCAEVAAGAAGAGRLRLFAGCGIVAGSRPLDELAESNAKLVPMRDALQD